MKNIVNLAGTSGDDFGGSEERLVGIRDRLDLLKKDLLKSTAQVEKRLEKLGGLLEPDLFDKVVLPPAIALWYFSGNLKDPLAFAGAVALYAGIGVLGKFMSSRRMTKKLAVLGGNITKIEVLISELNEELRLHRAQIGALKGQLTKGEIEMDAYASGAEKIYKSMASSGQAVLSKYEDVLDGKRAREFVLAPVITKQERAEIWAQIFETGGNIEELAAVQRGLLGDKKAVNSAQVLELLDEIEKKSLAEITAAVSLSVTDSSKREKLITSFREATAAGHVSLDMALASPNVLENLKTLKQIKKSVTFAVGDRTLAWRKLLHTTKIVMKYLPLYAAEISGDKRLNEADRDSLLRELRALVDGKIELDLSERCMNTLKAARAGASRLAEEEKYLRKEARKIGKKMSINDFDSIYRIAYKNKFTQEDRDSFLGQISLWSQDVLGQDGPAGKPIKQG